MIDEQRTDGHTKQDGSGASVKRRGILAAAGAVVAGLLTKQAAERQPVAADFGTWTLPYNGNASVDQPNLLFEVANFGTGTAILSFSNGGIAVAGSSPMSDAIYGIGGFNGVHGDSNGIIGNGVYGVTNASANSGFGGVVGTAVNNGNFGVYGSASVAGTGGTGVKGAGSAAGVVGESTSPGYSGVVGFAYNYVPTVGIYGGTVGVSNQANLPGVHGYHGGSGSGVQGIGSKGSGVYGTSTSGYGVLGYSTGGAASLAGISTNANIPAFAGGNNAPGGLAASFSGTVYVNGQFIVQDMTQKHGLLKHPDGSHRLMYTVEAPESWVEDFGTGTLVNGKTDVKLDSDFAALIHTEDYHVFLTEHSDHHLHVSQRGTTGFSVEADATLAKLKGKQATDLNGTFSWRVVAKPKSDYKVERLGKFTVPNVKYPDPATLPNLTESPGTRAMSNPSLPDHPAFKSPIIPTPKKP